MKEKLFFKPIYEDRIVEANILNEKPCYYFIDKGGIEDSNRIEKYEIGRRYFFTKKSCVENIVKIATERFEEAKKHLISCENELKKLLEKWNSVINN